MSRSLGPPVASAGQNRKELSHLGRDDQDEVEHVDEAGPEGHKRIPHALHHI